MGPIQEGAFSRPLSHGYWKSIRCYVCTTGASDLPTHSNGTGCFMADPESAFPICHCCMWRRVRMWETVGPPQVTPGPLNAVLPWV